MLAWVLSVRTEPQHQAALLKPECVPLRLAAYVAAAALLVLLAAFGVLLDTRGLEWAPAVGVAGLLLLGCACGLYCDVRAEHFKV